MDLTFSLLFPHPLPSSLSLLPPYSASTTSCMLTTTQINVSSQDLSLEYKTQHLVAVPQIIQTERAQKWFHNRRLSGCTNSPHPLWKSWWQHQWNTRELGCHLHTSAPTRESIFSLHTWLCHQYLPSKTLKYEQEGLLMLWKPSEGALQRIW